MGQSTDAILFYGYVWSDETELWDRGRHDEWYEALAKRRGIISPWNFYTDSGAEAEHSALPYASQSPAYEAWTERVGFDTMLEEWDAQKDAIKAEHPDITVASHCSCDYPMPYVCIASTNQRAWRGFPAFVNTSLVGSDNTPEWNEMLSVFTEALDIDVAEAEGPGWFLVSNWC